MHVTKTKHLFNAAVCEVPKLTSVVCNSQAICFDHNTVSLIYKWNYKVPHFTKKKSHLVRVSKRPQHGSKLAIMMLC